MQLNLDTPLTEARITAKMQLNRDTPLAEAQITAKAQLIRDTPLAEAQITAKMQLFALNGSDPPRRTHPLLQTIHNMRPIPLPQN